MPNELPVGRSTERTMEMAMERTVERSIERATKQPLYFSEAVLAGLVFMYRYTEVWPPVAGGPARHPLPPRSLRSCPCRACGEERPGSGGCPARSAHQTPARAHPSRAPGRPNSRESRLREEMNSQSAIVASRYHQEQEIPTKVQLHHSNVSWYITFFAFWDIIMFLSSCRTDSLLKTSFLGSFRGTIDRFTEGIFFPSAKPEKVLPHFFNFPSLSSKPVYLLMSFATGMSSKVQFNQPSTKGEV